MEFFITLSIVLSSLVSKLNRGFDAYQIKNTTEKTKKLSNYIMKVPENKKTLRDVRDFPAR